MHLAGGPETQFHAAFEPRGRQLQGHGMGGVSCLGGQLGAEVFADLGE